MARKQMIWTSRWYRLPKKHRTRLENSTCKCPRKQVHVDMREGSGEKERKREGEEK